MRIVVLTVALLGMFSVVGPAHAGLMVSLQSVAPNPLESNWEYTYELIFISDSVTSELRDGDFFTIYDIEGFVSFTPPAGFDAKDQSVGINADGTVPIDDPALVNVTFYRTGGTVTEDATFLASIVSIYDATKQGHYTAQSSTPELQGAIGIVPVATAAQAVPEPSTLLSGGMMALVGLGLAWRHRRSRVAARTRDK